MKNVRLVPQSLAKASLALLLVLLVAQAGGQAMPGDALTYDTGFLVTGNYVVGGVDLIESVHPIDVSGFSTGDIVMSGVPADADIIAAYLYWETLTLQSDPSGVNGVKFRGTEIDLTDPLLVRKMEFFLPGTNSTCWSQGQPLMGNAFRADVTSLLPMRMDAADNPTGKRLVNTSDLDAHQLPHHTVTLPVRSGNQVPESAGGSLVVVYRNPTEQLRKVVIYDGFYPQPSLTTVMQQSIQGFYLRSANPSAKLTHIIASGQPNNNDRIRFNGQTLATDDVPTGSSSQRAWANPTYNVPNSLMNANTNSATFGETAVTTVDHSPANGSEDCLTWGAVIFSTGVADVDHDGLPDGLENSATTMQDPDGRELPNLNLMGAGSSQADIFIEVNAMWAAAGTTYGSLQHPLKATEPIKTDPVGHNHMPSPEDLKMVGDAFMAKGIRPHFDVGDIAAYHAPNQPFNPKKFGVVQHSDWIDDYTSTVADSYLVPSVLAKGGELIKEEPCVPTSTMKCQFPAYPGTVRWKFGMQAARDAPVGVNGEQLAPAEIPGWIAGTTHRVRFDPARRGLFHYLLNAHARSKPKSPEPCLINGVPGPWDNGLGHCNVENPDFHVPAGTSGRAELPGGLVLVSMGLWNEFVGKPIARAGTIFHELGHNLGLNHGGNPPLWGSKAANTTSYFEPNCKPNYLSSMSYLFQVHGLVDANDEVHLDFSATAHGGINEAATVTDAALSPSAAYLPVWFAPTASLLAGTLGAPQATRFCSGAKFDPLAPPAPMARVYAANPTDAIDWNGDKLINTALPSQDINFDNALTGPPRQLNGYDDWTNVRLDQVGAGTDGYTQELLNGTRFGEMAPGTWGEGAQDQFDGAQDLFDGVQDLFDGAQDLFDGVQDQFDGAQDQFDGAQDQFDGQDELTQTHANGVGIGRPYGLTACRIGEDPGCPGSPNTPEYHRIELRFKASPTGANSYEIQRKRTAAADGEYETITETTHLKTNRFIDLTELADGAFSGVSYTYRVRVNSTEGTSPWSKEASVTAINLAPVGGVPAAEDAYTVKTGVLLTVAAPGLLVNDSDSDSPAGPTTTGYTGRRTELVSGPANGTLTWNTDGSFTYQSNSGFVGTDTFVYKADDGESVHDDALPEVPLSDFSADITVTITVTALQPVSLFLHGSGGLANPAILFLNTVSPTASTPAYKDSPAVNFNANNPWKDVGTWTAGPNTAIPTTLTAWLGLKNSGDINTAFDLRAEVYQNGTALVAFGENRCIRGLTVGANLAKLVSVTLAPGAVNGTLSLRLRTRVGTAPNNTRCLGIDASHTNAAGLRVYFDATTPASKLVVLQ